MSAHRAGSLRLGLLGYGLDRPLTGIGRYSVELAHQLSRCPDALSLELIKPFSASIAGLPDGIPARRIAGRRLPAYMLAAPSQLAAVARRDRLDIIHDPFGVSPFFLPRRIAPFKRVLTLHDVIPYVFPETHARLTNLLFRRYIPRSLRFVDRIITDSEASRRDIIRFLKFPAERVHAIPIGVAPWFEPAGAEAIARVRARYELPSDYILAVGSLNPRKNLETLFTAYHRLRQRGFPHRLVVVGPSAWKSVGIFQRLRDLGLERDVRLTGFVADEDLPALYSAAAALVLPSLYEGFGLPPLEAMACGTPVVTSNTSSLPEVVGDAGLMVDPLDVDALAAAIDRLLTDSELSSGLIARGLSRAQLFTWERTAHEHRHIYHDVLNDHLR
ncbi:MAG TPA: glycosyltransferase family 1 protein [Nitrolancea sp.]|nr:glycosyltransferase family 1 protein [Nitrolancea sp.]